MFGVGIQAKENRILQIRGTNKPLKSVLNRERNNRAQPRVSDTVHRLDVAWIFISGASFMLLEKTHILPSGNVIIYLFSKTQMNILYLPGD